MVEEEEEALAGVAGLSRLSRELRDQGDAEAYAYVCVRHVCVCMCEASFEVLEEFFALKKIYACMCVCVCVCRGI
jgi:hypothetical protein